MPSCDIRVGNRIRRIPDFIGHLTKLTHLEASLNQLESVSDAVSLCRALTTLSLTSNDLKALPDGLCNMSSLVTLKVDDNLLESGLESNMYYRLYRGIRLMNQYAYWFNFSLVPFYRVSHPIMQRGFSEQF